MSKILITILLAIHSILLFAKQKDSVFVVMDNNKLFIEHKIKAGETLLFIANRYDAPPAMVSDVNKLDYSTPLTAGNVVKVPLGAFNHVLKQPVSSNDARTLYYKVKSNDNLSEISNAIGITQMIVQKWNSLPDNAIHDGQTLLLGWVSGVMDTAEKENIAAKPVNKVKKEKSALPEGIKSLLSPEELAAAEAEAAKENYGSDSVSEEQLLFLSQTNHGSFSAIDKGAAVFFDMPGKKGKYYAFHNLAKRGTIIRISNPGTNKSIFAKVLGPIPSGTKYYNSVISISGNAKKELDARSEKIWCEITYAP